MPLHPVWRLASAIGLLFHANAAPTDALNRLTPTDGYTRAIGIPYASGPRHLLDVYAPTPRQAHAPVAVFLYGGGWQTGDRALYLYVGAALASRGVVTLIPDYRLFPAVRYPAFLQDAAAAVRYAHDHAAEFGGDPSRLFLIGHSAGAYLAAMLALDPRWLEAVGLSPARDIAGFSGLAGPYDFLSLQSPVLQAIFGPESGWPEEEPINHAAAGAPPALLLAGAGDKLIDPTNTQRLAARLQAAGDKVQIRIYPKVDHAGLVAAFSWPLRLLAPTLNDCLQFIRDVAQRPEPSPSPR
jgi:acetyl esterase/lipase